MPRAGTKSLKITDTDTTATYRRLFGEELQSRDFHGHLRAVLRVPSDGLQFDEHGLQPKSLLRVWCGEQSEPDDVQAPAYGHGGSRGLGPATGPALSENAWHCIEMHVAPPSASTAMQFWIDGTSAGTLTGQLQQCQQLQLHANSATCLWGQAIMAPARSTWTKRSSPIPTTDHFPNRPQSQTQQRARCAGRNPRHRADTGAPDNSSTYPTCAIAIADGTPTASCRSCGGMRRANVRRRRIRKTWRSSAT